MHPMVLSSIATSNFVQHSFFSRNKQPFDVNLQYLEVQHLCAWATIVQSRHIKLLIKFQLSISCHGESRRLLYPVGSYYGSIRIS